MDTARSVVSLFKVEEAKVDSISMNTRTGTTEAEQSRVEL